MRTHRIDSPTEIDAQEIARHIAAGAHVVVQFARTGYTAQLLDSLNKLARQHGRDLTVRFYGHYNGDFDASVLKCLPDAQCVSMDCLIKASNLDALSHLHNLKELRLGVFELDNADILKTINLGSLEALMLGETKNCRIDLAPLADCGRLQRLDTVGQTRNIASICELPSLQALRLVAFRKGEELDFVSAVPNLTALHLGFGGRASIAKLTAPQLQRLEVLRVQGLADLGDLGRFAELQSVQIEDQIRLAQIQLGANPKLAEIVVINCKTLARIEGLADLPRLSTLRIHRTGIDYPAFIERRLPRQLQSLAFYTGKQKRDAEIKADLAARGYR